MRRLPEALRGRWNHNTHYYGDALPFARGRALDVGCGDGLLLQLLAPRCDDVVGVDVSTAMVATARANCADLPNVSVRVGNVLTADLPEGGFDLVTAFTVIHHLEFVAGLRRLAALVRPGGTLFVLSLAKDRSPLEWAMGAVGVPAHRLLARHHGLWQHNAPVADPTMTWSQVRRAARRTLPGVRYRRHVLWRYSLTWTRPPHALPTPPVE